MHVSGSLKAHIFHSQSGSYRITRARHTTAPVLGALERQHLHANTQYTHTKAPRTTQPHIGLYRTSLRSARQEGAMKRDAMNARVRAELVRCDDSRRLAQRKSDRPPRPRLQRCRPLALSVQCCLAVMQHMTPLQHPRRASPGAKHYAPKTEGLGLMARTSHSWALSAIRKAQRARKDHSSPRIWILPARSRGA